MATALHRLFVVRRGKPANDGGSTRADSDGDDGA
jgi:hypothetical protein